MSALSIQPTYPIFTDIDGQPLEDGFIWIGVANLAPIVNPITVYWDAALTIPAAQPIRTRGGYPVNSGTPARLYVNSDYSIQIQNKNGSTVYSAPENLERFGSIDASSVVYTPKWTGALVGTVKKQLDEVIYVRNFIPAGTDTANTDCTAFIQAALDAGASKTIDFGNDGTWPVTFKTLGTLYISGLNTRIEGRGAVIDYYGTGAAFRWNLFNGTIYPQDNMIRQLNVYVNNGPSSSAFLIQTSHSRFEDVGIGLRVGATSAKGFVLVGDETNGTGPYYNYFEKCTVQSSSLSLDHIGVLFATNAPGYRGPNANVWVGGRIGQCATAFKITGNGNVIIGATIENVNTLNGICYDFVGPAAFKNTQNQVYGGYIENANTVFRIDALTNGTIIEMPYMTGVGTILNDLSPDAQILSGSVPNKLPTGIDFSTTAASANANVLDAYEEGTWVPTLQGGTTAGSYTITTTSAKYIKIGRQVTVTAKMNITVNSAGTGPLRFGGLPFPKDSDEFMAGGVITQSILINAAIMSLSPAAYTSSLDSTFSISGSRSNTSPLDIDCADVTAGAYVIVTITYTTQF